MESGVKTSHLRTKSIASRHDANVSRLDGSSSLLILRDVSHELQCFYKPVASRSESILEFVNSQLRICNTVKLKAGSTSGISQTWHVGGTR